MTELEEQTNILFYQHYGITEWNEKCCVLTLQEQIDFLEAIKERRETELTALVRLPFPQFVENYFSQFPSKHPYFDDPTFAYKLFFVSPKTLRCFTERSRNSILTKLSPIYNKKLMNWIDEIDQINETPFENIPKIKSSTGDSKQNVIRFLYISQYLDMVEVTRLNLPSRELFLKDGVDGYDLKGKLAILNPVIRSTIEMHLGIGHPKSYSSKEINKMPYYRGHKTTYLTLLHYLVPALFKPLGEFKWLLGFNEERQVPGNLFEYTNPKYRYFDIHLETSYHFAQLTESEQEILKKKTSTERMIYLASKFMFKTPESLARNLNISLVEAKKRLSNTKLT